MLFISHILVHHIFSYMILYCHILYICVFTLTIELTFMTDSRGNLIMFVIPYIFILYFSYTILSYDFHILCFSCTVLSYAFHILYLSYTFRVIDTLFLVFVYLSYTFLFHIPYLVIYFSCTVLCTFHILSYTVLCHFHILSYTMYFSYTVILYFTSYSCNCLQLSHSSVMLLISCHIFYTFHLHILVIFF